MLRASLLLPLLASSPAFAEGQFQVLGMGLGSCANWLQSPDMKTNGEAWIGGYWSGMNEANSVRSDVGKGSDAVGIFGEVELVCHQHPSMALRLATAQVYFAFQNSGR